MLHMRTLHLIIGSLGFVAFLLTGQYMLWEHGGLQNMPEGPRLFLRSAHIYLLWSSLLNIMLGCYLTRLSSGFARRLQLAGSVLILVGPFLLCFSFFLEPHTPELVRPIGQWAIILAFAGVAGQAGAMFCARFSGRASGKLIVEENPPTGG